MVAAAVVGRTEVEVAVDRTMAVVVHSKTNAQNPAQGTDHHRQHRRRRKSEVSVRTASVWR